MLITPSNMLLTPSGEPFVLEFSRGLPPENNRPVVCILDNGSLVSGEMVLAEAISGHGEYRTLRTLYDHDGKPVYRDVPAGQIVGYISAESRWPFRTLNMFIQNANDISLSFQPKFHHEVEHNGQKMWTFTPLPFGNPVNFFKEIAEEQQKIKAEGGSILVIDPKFD